MYDMLIVARRAAFFRKEGRTMPVLLIAESSDYLRRAMQDALSADCQVHTVSDGFSTLKQLETLRPDALIIDLSLTYMDGLQVLQQASFLPPVVMALCPFISTQLLHALQDAGCTYVMRMPCMVWAVADRLRSLLAGPPQPDDPQARAAQHLNVLGIPSHLCGYSMLALAIAVYAQDTTQSLSKEVYPAVAELLEDKYARHAIEHNIRRAISVGWHHRNPSLWSEYFTHSGMPSNKLFIATIANLL